MVGAQVEFVLRQMGCAALRTMGGAQRKEFATLYRIDSEERNGEMIAVFDLYSHQVAFLEHMKERMNRFYGGVLEIKNRSGTREELQRFTKDYMAHDADLMSNWRIYLDFKPSQSFRSVTIIIDPGERVVSLLTDANNSLSPSDYPGGVSSTSEALRFVAACLNQEHASIDLDAVMANPKLVPLLVEVLDKTGIDLNALRFNADNAEDWSYINTRFKKEIGEWFSRHPG